MIQTKENESSQVSKKGPILNWSIVLEGLKAFHTF